MLSILASQNPDGGWPYRPAAPSWTEPTTYALLALSLGDVAAEPLGRAFGWLRGLQRADGGWPPQPAVPECTWVTAMVALLGPDRLGAASYQRAIAWLLEQTGEDSGLLNRLHLYLLGNAQAAQAAPGWPWFPGATAWVTPTALSMLALRKAHRTIPSPALRRRLELGTAFLLQHACSDGGWNHGCPRVFNYEAPSYPETTGLALLALHGSDSPAIRNACRLAQVQLASCRSPEAQCWLRLGLLAHAQLPPDAAPPMRPPRTIAELALAQLASAAEHGHNVFLE